MPVSNDGSGLPRFICPQCGMISYNVNDIAHGYCGHCDDFTGEDRGPRGWWDLTCWNGLSPEQQVRLVTHGNLPLGYQPKGPCPNPAQVAIESEADAAPGPRFYCWDCGLAYVQRLRDGTDQLPTLPSHP